MRIYRLVRLVASHSGQLELFRARRNMFLTVVCKRYLSSDARVHSVWRLVGSVFDSNTGSAGIDFVRRKANVN